MKRRFLTLVLALVMILQMLPVFAQQTEAAPATSSGEVQELFTDRSYGQHPRLLADADDFDRVRRLIDTDPFMMHWYERLYQNATAALADELPVYELPEGDRQLTIARKVTDRVVNMAFVYHITGDRRFADRAVDELIAVSNFPDWRASEYLDLAQMAYGVAVGYDWLYNYMSQTQRNTVRDALYNYAVLPTMTTNINFWYKTSAGNLNTWCNGALVMAALAIMDDYPEDSAALVAEAVTNVQIAIATWLPMGSYFEAVSYYGPGVCYLVQMIEAMNDTLGTDFGLSQVDGMKDVADYLTIMNTGNNCFNYGDCSGAVIVSPSAYWFAKQYNMPELAVYERSHQHTTISTEDDYLALLWYDPELVEGYDRSEDITDHLLYSDLCVSVATFRSAPEDQRLIFAGIKSGSNNFSGHTDMDIGTFVMEAMGERWFDDLGSDSYGLSGYFVPTKETSPRWTYYRKRTEGQNTLVINPTELGGQNLKANCQMGEYESGYDGGFATVDMTDAYSTYGASSVKRGMALFDNRSRVLLRDEIVCASASEIYWFAHTKAAITISDGGKTAELTLKDKTLLAQIASPAEASFTVMAAVPLSTSPNPSGQNANSGYQKLTIHMTGVTSTQLAVVFTPIMEESDRSKELPTTAIADFGTLVEAYDPATSLQTNANGEYEIYTAEDLMCFADMVNSGTTFAGKTVKLMNDIDLENRTFIPIGGYTTAASGTGSKSFRGTFDGQNHVIKNLMIYEQERHFVALFGHIYNATVKNVGIENGYVFGNGRVAGLVAKCQGSTVTGCFNKAKVIGTYGQAGGLIARVDGACTVTDCYNNAIVKNAGSISGGIVGYVAENAVLSLSNCYHTGQLSDSQGSCGLIGYYPLNAADTATSVAVDNCYATDFLRGSTTSDRDYVTITNSEVISKDDLVSTAIRLGDSFMDDCGWENDGYPVFQWQNKTSLPEDYVLTNAAQLRLVAYLVNSGKENFSGKTLYLGRNIDLQLRQWVPIGGNMTTLSGGKNFRGTFDGQGHYVKNLKITGDRYYVGFFGNASGEIRNFGIQSGSVSAYRIGGGLTGNFSGTMRSCYNLADVECDIAAGGLAGMFAKSTVTDCYNGGDITAASYSYAGGIGAYFSGSSSGSLLKNCYNYGEISGKNRGGIVGIVNSSASDLTFENCYTTNTVGLTDESAAQFVVGGEALPEADLREASSLLGTAFTHDSYYVKNSGYPVLAVFSYKKGIETELSTDASGAYVISNADGLRALAYHVNVLGNTYAGKTIRLTADIDLEDVEWVPIGGSTPTNTAANYFSGTFEGGGHKIYNMVITSGNCFTGLFGHINNAAIHNVGVESGCVLGMRSAAGIAGWATNRSKIEGCYNKASVSGIAGIGGIVGMMGSGSSVKNCYNMGAISGPDSAAGLVGYVAGNTSGISISNSYNTGTLSAGLVGSVNATASSLTMDNCHSIDSVALVNTQNAMTVSNCTSCTKDELLLAAETLGSAFAEDYFTQNCIYPVLAWENGGKSTAFDSLNGSYLIQSADDLRLLSYFVRKGESFAGKTFVVTTDIDLQRKPFFPIGGTDGTNTYVFSGTLDGTGHLITNLYASNRSCTSLYVGLFGYTQNAVIRNLGIESGVVCNYKDLAGSFVAFAKSTAIENCYNKATARNHGGGVAGFFARAVGTCKLLNCYTVTGIAGGPASVGGLVGYTGTDITKLTIENCYTNCDFYITGQSGCGTFMGFISAGVSSSKLKLINSCYTGRTNSTSNRVSVTHRKLISPRYYTAEELKQAISYLGDAYAADVNGINGGFPVLAWETAGECCHSNVVSEDRQDGTHCFLCMDCGAVTTGAHSYIYEVTAEPASAKAGQLTGTCSVCTARVSVTLPKLNETDYTKTTVKEASCTETGTNSYKWNTDTYGTFTFTSPIAAKGHSEVVDKAVAPTCTETGLTEGKHCDRCGEVLTAQEVVPATGHVNTSTEITDATCTESGSVVVTCACGEVVSTEIVAALGHSEVVDKAVAPTCTETGLTEGKHCSVCNEVLAAQAVIAALGHSYDAGSVTTAPTLQKDGIITYACINNCGDAYTAVLEKLPENLLFDFGNSGGAQYRNYAYGFVNFDQASHWNYSTKRISGVGVNEQENALVITVLGEQDSSLSQMAAYVDVSKSGTSSDKPLHYDPSEAEVYQIRFRMENLTDAGSPYVDIHLVGKNDSGAVTPNAPNKALPKSRLNSGEYMIVTVPLGDTFANCKELTHVRAYFGNVKSIAPETPGTITIDYIYIGTLNGMPTKQFTVTFVDDDGKTLDTQTVYESETAVYGGKTPTKAYDSQNHYAFSGWDKSLKNVTDHIVVTAQFTGEAHKLSYTSTEAAHCASCACGYTETGEHKWDQGRITKSQSCTAEGEKTFVCEVCAGEKTEILAPLGHTEVTDEAVAASCTVSGLTEGKHCNRCGEVLTAQEVVPATGHVNTSTNTTDATCTEDGSVVVTCACGEVVSTEVVAALGHVEIVDKAVAPTCTESGLTEGKHCDRCGEVLIAQDVVPATGHVNTSTNTTDATCTEDGSVVVTCACGEVVSTEIVAALGHVEIADKAVAAICTESGLTEGKHCDRCGEVLTAQEVIPATGHVNTSTNTTDATCTESGSVVVTCACGEVVSTEVVAALGHVEVADTAVAATCTETGLTEGKHCDRCGEVLTAQEVIPATGHVNTSTNTTDATCTEDGSVVVTCACGELISTEIVAALGHSYAYTNNGDDHSITCANCDYAETEDHNFVDGSCICGAVETTVPTVDGKISIGETLSLESDLTMNLRIRTAQLAAYDLSTIRLVVERDIYNSDGTMEVETRTLTDYTIKDNRLVFAYTGISAAQMNDEIRVVLHIKDANGKEYKSNQKVTSVAIYSDLMLGASAGNEKLITLIMDMLNYGTAAQIYFNRHADAPVNEAFESFKTYASYASTDLKSALEDMSGTISNGNAAATVTQGLDLSTRVGITYKVKPPAGVDAASASLIIKDANGNALESFDLSTGTVDSKGRYCVTFFGSNSREMRRVVYATVMVDGEAISDTYSYTISSYAHTIANTAGMPEALVNLTRLMVIYGDSADAYFA